MAINPDTRISLLVGGIFIAAISLIYFGLGMNRHASLTAEKTK